jgi:hypothetical protein
MAYEKGKMSTRHIHWMPLAKILLAETEGDLVPGRQYGTTDQPKVTVFNAVKINELERVLTKEYVDTAVATEREARTIAVAGVNQRVTDEATARFDGDTAVTNAMTSLIQTETTLREQADTSLGQQITAGDAAVTTAMTSLINSQIESLKDTTVRNLIKKSYTNNETITLASLMAGQTDGIFDVSFKANDVSFTATVTGLPVGTDADAANITFGDRYKVVMDGGNVVSVVKEDDITKAKFTQYDTDIANLLANSVNGGENAVTVVAGKARLGGALIQHTNVSGEFDLRYMNKSVKMDRAEIGWYDSSLDADGYLVRGNFLGKHVMVYYTAAGGLTVEEGLPNQ